MYRAVALWAQRTKVALSDMHRLEQLAKEARIEFQSGTTAVLLNGEDVTEAIRGPEIADAASEVSRIPAVRRALVGKQRKIGEQESVVMEGRDIGSVVFPGTPYKFYIDASPEVRFQRRAAQGGRDEIAIRDRVDSSRAVSPLVIAKDAHVIDTSYLTIEEVINEIVGVLEKMGLRTYRFND